MIGIDAIAPDGARVQIGLVPCPETAARLAAELARECGDEWGAVQVYRAAPDPDAPQQARRAA